MSAFEKNKSDNWVGVKAQEVNPHMFKLMQSFIFNNEDVFRKFQFYNLDRKIRPSGINDVELYANNGMVDMSIKLSVNMHAEIHLANFDKGKATSFDLSLLDKEFKKHLSSALLSMSF